MKRWYQRQWWYIEKPMPWAMIILWPVLWFVGAIEEIQRWLDRPKPPVKDVYTCYRDNRGCDTPTQAWQLPKDSFDPSEWWVGEDWHLVQRPDSEFPSIMFRSYPIVDRDYE